MPLQTEYQFS